jgi:hypothetical protein
VPALGEKFLMLVLPHLLAALLDNTTQVEVLLSWIYSRRELNKAKYYKGN